MTNDVLNSLLKEYQQKKLNAELDLDRRKQNLYKLIPRLEEIDSELNNFAINTAKNILNNSSNSSSVSNLKQRILDLKKEKELILFKNNYNIKINSYNICYLYIKKIH